MNALMKRLMALGATSVIAVSGAFLVEPWETTKNQAYRDMIGIPTICAGYTINVKMGDYKTDDECDALLVKELTHFNSEMKKSVKVDLPENMEIAYTSLVWNIGIGAWNKSSILKKINNNDLEGACKGILAWNKATFKASQAEKQISRGEVCTIKKSGDYSCTVKGLTNRRIVEYKTCAGDNADVNKVLSELSQMNNPLRVDESTLGELYETEVLPMYQPEDLNVTEPPSQRTTTKHKDSCSFRFLWWCLK